VKFEARNVPMCSSECAMAPATQRPAEGIGRDTTVTQRQAREDAELVVGIPDCLACYSRIRFEQRELPYDDDVNIR
jgi:hypothetical protein